MSATETATTQTEVAKIVEMAETETLRPGP